MRKITEKLTVKHDATPKPMKKDTTPPGKMQQPAKLKGKKK